jgi:hypothetical protein
MPWRIACALTGLAALLLGCGTGTGDSSSSLRSPTSNSASCRQGVHWPCAPGFYCPSHDCQSPGQCVPATIACPDIWTPVCGCDGKNYPNACWADVAAVIVAQEGTCDGSCAQGPRWPCAPGSYCPSHDCQSADQCVPATIACPDIWSPVCGCDGKSYPNACWADAAAVIIAHDGTCDG